MCESPNQENGLAPAIRRPPARTLGGIRCLVMCAMLVSATVPASLFAQSSCAGIHVEVLNIRNSSGSVACALFESPAGFPKKFLRSATKIMMIKIQDTQARCDFLDVPPGTYALPVIHDENMDGELGTNFLGMPDEGYAFSNEAQASMSAPSFEDASFTYDGEKLDLTIELNY